MSSQDLNKDCIGLSTQEITLKLPITFEIPVEYIDTSPHENAAILLLGRSLLNQLRRDSYNSHILALEEELRKERASTERFHKTVDSLKQTIDHSIEQAVANSYESLSVDVKDLSLEILKDDKKERETVAANMHRDREAFERRVASLSLLLDRVSDIEKRQHEREVARSSTSAIRGHDNETDSHQLILRAFGSNGTGFRFHPKKDFSGDHVFDWNGLRIMWEDKRYASSVPRAEVEKAWRDIAANGDCHVLLFVSALSGIVSRESSSNLFSEVRNGQLIIYLSNFKQNADQVGYLCTVIQTILSGVKPLLLVQSGEATDERISLAASGLSSLSQSLNDMQKSCDTILTDFRVKLSTLKNSIERIKSGIDSLSQSICSTSVVSESTKAQRKCSKCGQPGHTIRTCTV
jgi:hypothetical protein